VLNTFKFPCRFSTLVGLIGADLLIRETCRLAAILFSFKTKKFNMKINKLQPARESVEKGVHTEEAFLGRNSHKGAKLCLEQ